MLMIDRSSYVCSSDLYAFALFSLAFIARPFGSLLFRFIHEWYGRGTKLTVALFMMGTATAGIAFLPVYSDIGVAAIVLLSLLRFAQGLSLGARGDGFPSVLPLTPPPTRPGWQ